MSCERYVEAVADAAAGRGLEADLEAHVAACTVCRSELRAQEAVLSLVDGELSGLLDQDPSPSLRARIREAVEERGVVRWGAAPRWELAAAALLLACGLFAIRGDLGPGPVRDTDRDLAEGTPRAVPTASVPAAAAASPDRHPSPPALRRTFPEPSSAPKQVSRTAPRPLDDPDVVVPDQSAALAQFATELADRVVAADSLLVAELETPLVAPRPLYVVSPAFVTPETGYVSVP